jgi:hypothetical protein
MEGESHPAGNFIALLGTCILILASRKSVRIELLVLAAETLRSEGRLHTVFL